MTGPSGPVFLLTRLEEQVSWPGIFKPVRFTLNTPVPKTLA